MKHLLLSSLIGLSVPAFADLGELKGVFRVDRVCSDGAKPADGLIDGTLFVSFGENKSTSIFASFLVPEAGTYCAERSSGDYETKEDGLRVRVAKREYLGDCGGAKNSEEKPDDAGEFIPLERTDQGFKGTSGTDFDEGGSCKRGTHMNFTFTRVAQSEPASAAAPAEAAAPEAKPSEPTAPSPTPEK